jgi:medium-chain acyl-[acyl-carrier-protein] hydrolase
MEQKTSPVWTENFKINSLLVNPFGQLGLFGTLNLLQETAWMHAETLGFGLKGIEAHGMYWVLTRQILEMRQWPAFNQKVRIETWLRPPLGAFAGRDFSIIAENGEEIGACTTSWLALDKESKRILPLPSLADWKQISVSRTTGLTAGKIPVEGEYQTIAQYGVRNSDLDMNQHVNNTKYSQWILDAIPYQAHQQLKLKSYTVNFLGETFLGDEVRIDRGLNSSAGPQKNEGSSLYRGVRIGDEKILFTAKLDWETRPAISHMV